MELFTRTALSSVICGRNDQVRYPCCGIYQWRGARHLAKLPPFEPRVLILYVSARTFTLGTSLVTQPHLVKIGITLCLYGLYLEKLQVVSVINCRCCTVKHGSHVITLYHFTSFGVSAECLHTVDMHDDLICPRSVHRRSTHHHSVYGEVGIYIARFVVNCD